MPPWWISSGLVSRASTTHNTWPAPKPSLLAYLHRSRLSFITAARNPNHQVRVCHVRRHRIQLGSWIKHLHWHGCRSRRVTGLLSTYNIIKIAENLLSRMKLTCQTSTLLPSSCIRPPKRSKKRIKKPDDFKSRKPLIVSFVHAMIQTPSTLMCLFKDSRVFRQTNRPTYLPRKMKVHITTSLAWPLKLLGNSSYQR